VWIREEDLSISSEPCCCPMYGHVRGHVKGDGGTDFSSRRSCPRSTADARSARCRGRRRSLRPFRSSGLRSSGVSVSPGIAVASRERPPSSNGACWTWRGFMTANWGEPIAQLRRSLGLRPKRGIRCCWIRLFAPYLKPREFSSVLGRPQTEWPVNSVQTASCSTTRMRGGTATRCRLSRFRAPPSRFSSDRPQ